jgi:hypothetical protein
MAADTPITVTPANVLSGTGAATEVGIAGEAITAGQTVYKKTLDGFFWKADADATAVGANAEIDNVYGISLTNSAAGQPITVQKSGDIICGGTVVPGTMYVQSGTAGCFTAIANLTTANLGDYVITIGMAITTSVIHMMVYRTGVALPIV